jgi:hypothetical protein
VQRWPEATGSGTISTPLPKPQSLLLLLLLLWDIELQIPPILSSWAV